jgi:hypothetical protein
VACLFVFLGVGEVSEGVAEGFAEGLAEGLSGFLGLEVVVLDVLEVEFIDQEPGGEDVILVDILDEGLDTGLLDELLLAISPLGLRDVSGDACNE